MEIKFYPYDFDYKVEGEKVFVYLFGRLPDGGGKVCVKQEYKPYFYAALENVDQQLFEEKLKSLKAAGEIAVDNRPAIVTGWEEVEKELLGNKKPFCRIFVNYPKAVPPIAREIKSWGLECYEKDILFVHRYLRDKQIIPLSLTCAKGKYLEKEKLRLPVFLAEEVYQSKRQACENWKILSLDIETYFTGREMNPKKNPILMIAFYGTDEKGDVFRKVITWKIFRHELDFIEFVGDEKEMLQRFREILLSYNPDIITGYFSDGCDFPYIKERAERNNVVLDVGLDYSELSAGKGSGFREGEGRVRGMLHLDVFKFIKHIFGKDLKTDSFTLDAVSEELIGHKKHKVDIEALPRAWDNEPEKLPEYCAYNLHDAFLAFKLCEKLLPDMIEFTNIVGLPTFDLIRMSFSRLVENYILKRAIECKVLAPNKPGDDEIGQRMEESIEGAFVYEPTPGLYENIAVFDFRSLYPTIITAYNIGPEGFQCRCCKNEPHVPGKDNYWFCKKERKFIPSVLEELILRRMELKKQIKEVKKKKEDTKLLEARSYAIKILANSFYGYLGFYGARWYCLECAASTTAYARDYIHKTIDLAGQKGFQVIYADTDSCFLLLGDKPVSEATAFMAEINKELPGMMELEFEGLYVRGIFVALKSSEKGQEKGAKKKYALLSEDGRLKIKGFETVRRNWSSLAKEAQEEVLSLVLNDNAQEAISYVRNLVQDLKKGKIAPAKLLLKMQITKEISEYASFGPHVKIAQEMRDKGMDIFPGMVIEYVIVKGSGLVRERAKIPAEVLPGEYDAEYYLQHQLIPAVSGIFAVLGHSEEELFSESSQTGLGKFF